MILAWWYVHVSEVPSSPLRLMHYAVFLSVHAFLVHALHSLTVAASHSSIIPSHSSIIHVSHSCVTLIHCSCVALILRSCIALIPYSCFSHAAWSLLDLLFSLTCIKSQTSQPEYSATVRTSMRADVHIAHCRPTQLLFSKVHIA